jgi:hypothetical protein
MKLNQTKKLTLNKKTVSVLHTNEMAAIKGGADDTTASYFLGGFTQPRSDSFVACGSCFGNCATNSTACPQPQTIVAL